MVWTRREVGKLMLAAVPGSRLLLRPASMFAADKPNSKFAGVQVGLAIILYRHAAVHHHVPVAARALDATPLAAGEVVRDLGRQALEAVVVVDDDVRGRADGERPPVAEAGAVRRQR